MKPVESLAKRLPVLSPFPEVTIVLDELLPSVEQILGDRFLGMYLYGSLAYGGFDRDSDVDFVVITKDELTRDNFTALKEMHARIAALDSWCATQLEGSYLPLQGLQVYQPQRVLYYHIDRGRDEELKRMEIEEARLSRAWWGGWVLLRAVLWESGIVLAGPAPDTLINPVPPQEIRQANLAILQGWLVPLLEGKGQIPDSGYQAYFVLTLCRMLYTFEYGAIASKRVAARWAKARLGQPWSALIERAWDGRRHPQRKVKPEDVKETLAFIRHILELSQSNASQARPGPIRECRKGECP